jgi:hypothetical protein
MPIDKRSERLDESDWKEFACAWLAELRGAPIDPSRDFGSSVVMMGFTATPDQQWQFIRASVAQAESDDELGHIAAGPMECLLGRHGASCIDAVEHLAATDARFARILMGVWKYMMTDDVWSRVQAVKARYSESGDRSPRDT